MNAPARLAEFKELAKGLGWTNKLIAMLWGYFDEAGEHNKATGHLTRLAIGGFLAPYDEFQAAIEPWQKALDDEGVKVFHMTDFEANQGEFAGWEKDRPKHERLLDNLLAVLDKAKFAMVGVSWPAAQSKKKVLRRTYETCFAQVINGAATTSFLEYDAVQTSLVFAEHPEFKAKRIVELYEAAKGFADFFRSCTIAKPCACVPLQMADLVAYEVAHAHNRDQENRYPWIRLLRKYDGAFPGLPRCASFSEWIC